MSNITIDIITPNIFPKNQIISGMTKRNFEKFPPKGFTISPDTNQLALNHRKILAEFLNIDISKMKYQRQIHSDIIQIMDENSPNSNQSDAMITTIKGLVLNISLADCTGVLIYDPIQKVIAAIHSGWRGTKLNISAKAVNIMNKYFNSKPKDLLVYLTPCASFSNYEVEWDVAKHFPYFIKKIGNGKFLFDNSSQIKHQLLQIGILESNIEKSDICTISNLEFHSFRRDKENSGRMSAFIGMI